MPGKANRGCARLPLLTLLLMLSACSIPFKALPGELAEAPAAPGSNGGWSLIAPGLEWREWRPEQDQVINILRIDPQSYSFQVKYNPRQPYSLAQWRAKEPAAVAIVNANFFDPSYVALGLVVSDGEARGRPYLERGGSFLVKQDRAAVRANDALLVGELAAVEQAVQGFPLLVENGEQRYFGPPKQERARRTAIAEDKTGKILIIIAPFVGPTLGDLSALLAESELGIETAVNLDGGGSTLLAVPAGDYFQPSFDAVPVVIAVYKR